MPVIFELQENGWLMYFKIADPWKMIELVTYYKQTETIFDSASHTVHSLVDVRYARQLPAGVLSVRHVKTWHHPRSGQTAIIGAAPLARAMLDTIFQLTRFNRARFFDSEADARQYLSGLIDQEARARS